MKGLDADNIEVVHRHVYKTNFYMLGGGPGSLSEMMDAAVISSDGT